MTAELPAASNTTRQQWGAVLPDGRIIWDHFSDTDINTADGRSHIYNALVKTGNDLGFPQTEFLRHYGWATRTITVATTDAIGHAIGDPAVYQGTVETTGAPGDNQYPSDGDAGAVREGHLGSPS